MNVDCKTIPKYKLEEKKRKDLIMSQAKKLLDICCARTVVLGYDDNEKPFILVNDENLVSPLDFCFDD